ncbi:hypothetical protein DM860_017153 [Cuscuta australis]|uniref:DUF4408 domain-containing protein n=1 Tax=Cuscuta australis TaxID=267555 RepID=A0A328DYA5_9ASTE|nr:hypothetical protein DM860_017153 [Cuscuta australis]
MLLAMMMRALFQCQGQKTLQTAILAVEILLLPPGLISTFLMLRRAAAHLHLLLPGGEHWARRVRLSPSPPPLFMCVFVNSIVILILLTSSKLHRRRQKNDSLFDLFSYDAGDPSGTLSSPPAAALTVTLDHNDNNGRSLRDDEDHTTKENLHERRPDSIEATWAAIHCGCSGDDKLKKSGTWPKLPPQPQTAEHDTVSALPLSAAAAEAKSPPSVVAETKSLSPMAVAKKSPPSVAATAVKSPPSVATATARSLPSVAATGVKSPPSVATATAKSLPSVAAEARKEKELRKSTTFTDAVPRRGGVRGPEELDKRFEEFIRNFNHELRLERQDSEERFWERMKRGLN